MIKPKRNKIIISCAIIVSFLIIVARYTPVSILIMDILDTTKSMSDEQVVKAFNENQNDFINAEVTLSKYPYITWIEKATSEKRSAPEGRYEYKSQEGIFVQSKYSLANNDLEYIDHTSINKIIKKMKFKSITNNEKYTCFIQASSLSDANGLMYIPDIKHFDEKDVEIEPISQGWYIFHDK